MILKTDDLTMEQRIERIDTLLCILFSGLVANPLAPNLIPFDELQMLKAMLPENTTSNGTP